MPHISLMVAREKCPACRRTGAPVIVELPFDAPPLSLYLQNFYRPYPQCDFSSLADERYRLAECPDCGCIHQNPVPVDAFLTSFYETGLYGSPRAEPKPVDPYQVEQIMRELTMVVRFLQPRVARPSVLDFGTGDGQWAQLAAAAGLDTHACDLSDHAFPLLESRGITCHRLDALPAALFDFINTEQVFEHLPRPAEELAHLVQALRPGGIIKIGVPHDPQLRQKLRQPDWTAPKNSPASLNGVAPLEHLNHFELTSLRAMGKQAGVVPLTVVGWNLCTSDASSTQQGLRFRFGNWLRKRLGDFYRPHFALTQTCFFQKPAPPPI